MLAVELQELVRTKVGTSKFSDAYNSIRQQVLSVRRDRKAARVIQVRLCVFHRSGTRLTFQSEYHRPHCCSKT